MTGLLDRVIGYHFDFCFAATVYKCLKQNQPCKRGTSLGPSVRKNNLWHRIPVPISSWDSLFTYWKFDESTVMGMKVAQLRESCANMDWRGASGGKQISHFLGEQPYLDCNSNSIGHDWLVSSFDSHHLTDRLPKLSWRSPNSIVPLRTGFPHCWSGYRSNNVAWNFEIVWV